jgi:hypothetical protein
MSDPLMPDTRIQMKFPLEKPCEIRVRDDFKMGSFHERKKMHCR